MKGQIHDYPTRMVVHSETTQEDSYLVDLTAFPRGFSEEGVQVFNGSCTCDHFRYNCKPKMHMPMYDKALFRCKHIRWARENVLDYLLPVMKQHDPNIDEEHQT